MSYFDEVNELHHLVTLGPYQFNISLTFTEIEQTECSRISKAISLGFVEMLLIPAVLKPFHQTLESNTYIVRPFLSRREDDNCWLYDYHLFITKQLIGLFSEISTGTDDLEFVNENYKEENNLPASLSGSSDEFDLTISNSLENKIDSDFWFHRLNFGQKLADSYTYHSKLSLLQNLGLVSDKICLLSDHSQNQDLDDFELFDSIASVYKDIGPLEVDENIPPNNHDDQNVSTKDIASHANSVNPIQDTPNFSLGVENVLGGSSQSKINDSVDSTPPWDHQITKNTDSQETICDIGSLGCQENAVSQITGEGEEKHAENTQPSTQASTVYFDDYTQPSSHGNEHVSDGDESQASTVYFDTHTVDSLDQNHSPSSGSGEEFKSPVSSPKHVLPFAASQAYKSGAFNIMLDSLNLPQD